MHKNNSSVMKRWIAGLSATFVMALSGLVPEPNHAEVVKSKFYCSKDESGTPITIADNGRGRRVILIRWVRQFSADWSPERRCEQVAWKFQQTSDAGNLKYLVPARTNGLPVICASKEALSEVIEECPDSRILMTLRIGDDPSLFIQQLFEINTGMSAQPLSHSSAIIRINQINNLSINRWLVASASVIPPIQDIPSTRKNPWGNSSENLTPSNRSREGKIPLAEQDKQVTFACVITDKIITTVARTSNQDIPIITWTSNFSSDWTPEKRCQQVTKKFENLRQKNALNYITTSVVNSSPIICAVKTVNESCTEDEEILVTLKDRSEAQKVLDQMFLSNSDIPVDDNGVGKRDGRDSVCMSRSSSGNCSGLLISAIEL